MEEDLIVTTLNLFGYKFNITESLIIQWIILILIISIAFVLTRDLRKLPNKKQSVAEVFVDGINNFVKSNMGEEYLSFVPYVGTLVVYLLLMNLVGLFGIEPPTTQYSVTLGLALISFVIIQGYTIKKVGVIHYFVGYTKPLFILFPINIMERLMLPVSLSLRLFGNMFAASIILKLIYDVLGSLGKSFGAFSWITQLAIPVPLHAYFDLFDGTLQMIIFVMLTMINIKIISEH